MKLAYILTKMAISELIDRYVEDDGLLVKKLEIIKKKKIFSFLFL